MDEPLHKSEFPALVPRDVLRRECQYDPDAAQKQFMSELSDALKAFAKTRKFTVCIDVNCNGIPKVTKWESHIETHGVDGKTLMKELDAAGYEPRWGWWRDGIIVTL